MKALQTGLSLLMAAIAIAALPAVAGAEYLVPPGNSAATQYTEAVPTAGGPKATGKLKHGQNRSPDQVLGTRDARRLGAQGPEGRAAAEVAAETAPATVAPTTSDPSAKTPQQGNEQGGAGGSQASGSKSGGKPSAAGAGAAHDETSPVQQDSGGSGLGEVAGQATGSASSGELGLLLPLLVLGALAWSVAYVLRQRKRPTD
jgi:hypothetical protein